MKLQNNTRTLLRIGSTSIIAVQLPALPNGDIQTETFIPRSGISMAANLRDALQQMNIFAEKPQKVIAMVEAPLIHVPTSEFQSQDADTLFYHCFEQQKNEYVEMSEIEELNCMVLFQVSKDLRVVLQDTFADVRIIPLMQPLWTLLQRRSHTGLWKKLYAYCHDKRLELFAFDKNRFRFSNQLDGKYAADNVYYCINAWQQLGYNVQRDELHVAAPADILKDMLPKLQQHISKVSTMDVFSVFTETLPNHTEQLPLDLQAAIVTLTTV